MKKLTIKTLMLLVMIAGLVPVLIDSCYAEEASMSTADMSAKIFGVINEFRLEPYRKTIEFVANERAVSTLPAWTEELKGKSFKRLSYNSRLMAQAENHIDDMFSRNYYSEFSPDGMGLAERVTESGISFSESKEALGIVLFRNYFDKNLVVDSVIRTIIKTELLKERFEDSLLFNENLTEMAVQIKSGTYAVQGKNYNSYIAVCDAISTDREDERKLESIMSVLINQARMKPLEVFNSYGLDTVLFVSEAQEFYPALMKIDYKKEEFAKYSINWLPESGYYVISKENYEIANPVSKTISIKQPDSVNENNINDISTKLFGSLAFKEYESEETGKIIKNKDINRLYAKCWTNQISDEGLAESETNIEVRSWHEENTQFETSGIIYKDLNSDGLYNPGEEKSKEQLFLFNAAAHLKSDLAGAYYKTDLSSLSFLMVIFDDEAGTILKEKNAIPNGKFCFENLM